MTLILRRTGSAISRETWLTPTAARNCRDDIPPDVDTGDLVDLEPVTWKNVSKFAREAEELQSERETREAVQRLLEDGEHPESDFTHAPTRESSRWRWLAASVSTESNDGSEAFRIAVFSAVFSRLDGHRAGSTGASTAILHPARRCWYLLVWLRARSQSKDGGNSRDSHRKSFEKNRSEPAGEVDRRRGSVSSDRTVRRNRSAQTGRATVRMAR